MEEYEALILEVIFIDAEDVITCSSVKSPIVKTYYDDEEEE